MRGSARRRGGSRSASKAMPSKGAIASKSSSGCVVKGDLKLGQAYLKAVQESGWKGGAQQLLKKLKEDENAWPFMQSLPNAESSDKIKKHMDLPTIGDRLQNAHYIRGGRKEFLRDSRTVFDNVLKTHDEDSQLYVMAQKMSALFELEWASLMLILDRKDSAKFAGEDGGGGACGSGAKWEPHCEQLLERLLTSVKGQQLFKAFPPGAGANKAQRQLYLETVPEPMDEATIKDRLASKAYSAPKDFNRDVWLILNNAKVYYGSDEMRKGGQQGLVDLAEELLRDFEEDYAATQPKFSEGEGGGKTVSVFACEPPLRLPRRRQPLARKDLPWKNACLKVLAALGQFVQTERQAASEAAAAVSAGWEDVAAALERVGQVVLGGRHRHVLDFVRDCQRAFRAARLAAAGKGGTGATTDAGKGVKQQVREVLQTQLKLALEQVVADMSQSLLQAALALADSANAANAVDDNTHAQRAEAGKGGQDGEEGEEEELAAQAAADKEEMANEAEAEEWLEEARLQVLRLARHPAAWALDSLPSPWTKQGMRYAAQVTCPMDLSTVHALLEHGHYTSLAQVAADLHALLDNLKTAPGSSHDDAALAELLRAAYLAAPRLAEKPEQRPSRQEQRRQEKAAAAASAAAAAAAAASTAAFGKMGAELQELDNWKGICVRLVRQLASMPAAWVLQHPHLAESVPASQPLSPMPSSPSPSKQAAWAPKGIPGLTGVLKRLEDNVITDPLQVLHEVRLVLSRYLPRHGSDADKDANKDAGGQAAPCDEKPASSAKATAAALSQVLPPAQIPVPCVLCGVCALAYAHA